MTDSFTETTTTGFFGNLGGAIKGVLTGVVLFGLSFPVLWWNEGRTNMSQVAKQAQEAPAKPDAAMEGKFIWASGTLATDGKIGDPAYLKPGNYIGLHRTVEMYAWVEEKHSKTEKKTGGKKVTTTTYTYKKKWTSSPKDSSSFKERAKHTNPPLTIRGESWFAPNATVGAYSFDPGKASMGSSKPLLLKPDMLKLTVAKKVATPAMPAETPAGATTKPSGATSATKSPSPGQAPVKPGSGLGGATTTRPATGLGSSNPGQPRLEGKYLYLGSGSMNSPRVGDTRISFSAILPGEKVTIFGQQNGTSIEPYVHSTGDQMFRVFSGTRDQAIAQLASEFKMITWTLRIVGFLMMWIGMGMVFGPLHAVMDVLPFLGDVSRTLVSVVLFPIALVLAIVTIVVSKIAHSPVALVVIMVLLIGGGAFWIKSRGAKQPA